MLVSGPPDVLLLLLLLNTREAHHIWISIVLQPDKSFLKAGFFHTTTAEEQFIARVLSHNGWRCQFRVTSPLPHTQFSRSKDCLI